MHEEREIRLFRNGRNRAVRIPVEWDVFGDTVAMRRDGNRVTIDLVRPKLSLADLLDSFETLDEEWPELPDPPPDPIKFR